MSPFDVMQAHLLDLLWELREANLRLILGGGYGLYLKEEGLRKSGERTLLEVFPPARSTNDLDIFLCAEVLANPTQARAVRAALERLAYEAVPGAEYYQFKREGVKIDILTGPTSRFAPSSIRTEGGASARRIKPKQKGVGLHAHSTEEAVTLEEELAELEVRGVRTSGEEYAARIYLPHPFTYATMKLFSTRDKELRGQTEGASKHALDLYRVVAMMTQTEWETASRLRDSHLAEPPAREAAGITRDYFRDKQAVGMLRMREHPQFDAAMQLDEFLDALRELFPSAGTT